MDEVKQFILGHLPHFARSFLLVRFLLHSPEADQLRQQLKTMPEPGQFALARLDSKLYLAIWAPELCWRKDLWLSVHQQGVRPRVEIRQKNAKKPVACVYYDPEQWKVAQWAMLN